MVRAGYVWGAIIHWALTWTTGSLLCTQMLMHVIAHRGVWTPQESLHWKLSLGRKPLAEPRESNLHQWCDSLILYQLSCFPSQFLHRPDKFISALSRSLYSYSVRASLFLHCPSHSIPVLSCGKFISALSCSLCHILWKKMNTTSTMRVKECGLNHSYFTTSKEKHPMWIELM